jgi:hypothetical protein
MCRSGFVEHRAVHPPEHVDLAGQPIGERKAQHAMAHDGHGSNVWG